jgi:signal transduction histidine kinase
VTYDDTVVWDAFDVGFLDDIERIVVEALRNAVKHARATSVAVITSRDPDTGDLLLTITDDGVGGARQSATGRGLTIMDSVVAGRFGRMTLDSADGHGTTVQVRVQPLFASEWAVVERSLSDRDD